MFVEFSGSLTIVFFSNDFGQMWSCDKYSTRKFGNLDSCCGQPYSSAKNAKVDRDEKDQARDEVDSVCTGPVGFDFCVP